MEGTTGRFGSDTTTPGTNPELAFDPSQYRDEIQDINIPEEQVVELLETLWSIMRMFVELGYSADVGGAVVRQIFNEQARPPGGGED
jgi:hypothetical protein